jgi:hypothetical protein
MLPGGPARRELPCTPFPARLVGTMAVLKPAAARAVAAEAFMFGYPLVLTDVTRAVTMAMPQGGGRVPANEFAHLRESPMPRTAGVVTPKPELLDGTWAAPAVRRVS